MERKVDIMGTWSYEVLSNDSALDMMGYLCVSKNIKTDIYNILHEKHDTHEFLLAVEIVDVSLNGINEEILGGLYDYEGWFKNIEKNPMEDLREDAIHVIKFIQETEEKHGGWVNDVKEDRKQLLIKIENRLRNGN